MTITAPTYSTLNVEASGSQAVVTASIPQPNVVMEAVVGNVNIAAIPPVVASIAVNSNGAQGPAGIGNVLQYVAGEAFNSHTPLVLINNQLFKLSNTIADHQHTFVGFSKTSAIIGQMVQVEQNIITLFGWGLVPNTNYLAGPNGSIITSNTNPNTFTKIIGFSENSDTLLIYKNYTSINYN